MIDDQLSFTELIGEQDTAEPLAFVSTSFELSGNDVLTVPRLVYVQYPDGTVKGTITVRECQTLPSRDEAEQELASCIHLSADTSAGTPSGASGGASDDASGGASGGASGVGLTHQINTLSPAERSELERILSRAILALKEGPLAKVVLSWKRTVATPVPLPPFDALAAMRRREPASWLLAHVTPDSAMVGITPELVLSRKKSAIESLPIAGTISAHMAVRSDTPGHGHPVENLETILFKSAKDRLEHKLTVDAVVSAFNRYCSTVYSPSEPEILRLSSVIHLQSPVSGKLLPELDVPGTTLKLLQELHPTPAVAGVPRDLALTVIAALESQVRGTYAGVTGWIAPDGGGCFVLNIRTATITANELQFQAGAGLVASSDAHNEAMEIEAKLESIASIIRTVTRDGDPSAARTASQPQGLRAGSAGQP
ncbi:MAG: chorismate-binding protein [Acidimicrobiales bacterium]